MPFRTSSKQRLESLCSCALLKLEVAALLSVLMGEIINTIAVLWLMESDRVKAFVESLGEGQRVYKCGFNL